MTSRWPVRFYLFEYTQVASNFTWTLPRMFQQEYGYMQQGQAGQQGQYQVSQARVFLALN